MRVVTNIVDPKHRERLANAKRRIAETRRRGAANSPTVARAIEASRKAKCARRNRRGI